MKRKKSGMNAPAAPAAPVKVKESKSRRVPKAKRRVLPDKSGVQSFEEFFPPDSVEIVNPEVFGKHWQRIFGDHRRMLIKKPPQE